MPMLQPSLHDNSCVVPSSAMPRGLSKFKIVWHSLIFYFCQFVGTCVTVKLQLSIGYLTYILVYVDSTKFG